MVWNGMVWCGMVWYTMEQSGIEIMERSRVDEGSVGSLTDR